MTNRIGGLVTRAVALSVGSDVVSPDNRPIRILVIRPYHGQGLCAAAAKPDRG